MKCLVILFSIILMACANNAATVKTDTTGYVVMATTGTLRADTSGNASLRRENDSLRTVLFQAQFKVNKVRYYLKICLRNPTQDKYLKGWIKRAIQ